MVGTLAYPGRYRENQVDLGMGAFLHGVASSIKKRCRRALKAIRTGCAKARVRHGYSVCADGITAGLRRAQR